MNFPPGINKVLSYPVMTRNNLFVDYHLLINLKMNQSYEIKYSRVKSRLLPCLALKYSEVEV